MPSPGEVSAEGVCAPSSLASGARGAMAPCYRTMPMGPARCPCRRGDRRGRGVAPAGRRAGRDQGQDLHARPAHDLPRRAYSKTFVPPYDATVVERLRAAGAVIVGKTNCDEFAMGSSTENSAFGADAQPVGLDARAGRLERRVGRGGRGRAWRRSRWAPTPAARSGSRRRSAASSGMKPTYGRVSRYGLRRVRRRRSTRSARRRAPCRMRRCCSSHLRATTR